jgi:hypothetical protein
VKPTWVDVTHRILREARGRLTGAGRDRKFRLFCCGCLRLLYPRLTLREERACVEAGEQFADDTWAWGQMQKARAAWVAADKRWLSERSNLSYSARRCCDDDATGGEREQEGAMQVVRNLLALGGMNSNPWLGLPEMVGVARCVFGGVLLGVRWDRSWNSPAAVSVARAAYDDRDWGLLPLLADALQDAGCEHPRVLWHLRGRAKHCRGCWVVDLALGKGGEERG